MVMQRALVAALFLPHTATAFSITSQLQLLKIRGGGTNRIVHNLAASSSSEVEDTEPKTGWLHNTEPKYYMPPSNDNISR